MRKQIIFMLIFAIFLSSCSVKTDEISYETSDETAFCAETFPSGYLDTEKESEASGIKPDDIREDDAAQRILSEMTLKEKVGQLFLVRNPKTEFEGLELIEEKGVGGIIFFARDFKNSTPDKFKGLISSYFSRSSIPLLTAVDEEGGDVCRISNFKAFRDEKFKSPSELYTEGGMEKVLSDCNEKSEFLLSLGINFNLAPVADISTDANDFIFHRSIGMGRDETAEYASSLVKRMNENGILSALKHFPGYGNNEDTHTGIAYDNRSLRYLRENDLVPFAQAINVGAPVVMVSHNVITNLDSEYPASLSAKAYGLLREELNFEGVIMTDDLSMGAIGYFTESGEAAVLAIEAGADLLCCSDIETQYDALLEAVENGRISIDRIEDSVLRLLKMKLDYGIISKTCGNGR